MHECPGCGRPYHCVHKNCSFVVPVKCDECVMKADNAFIQENLRKASENRRP